MSFHLNPIWSYSWVILATLGLVALVLITYPQRVRHLPPVWRRTLLGLRLVTALVLGFAMLRPEIRQLEENEKPRLMVIMGDVSRSMTTRDAAGGISRREELVQTLNNAEGLLAELGEKYEIQYFDFAAELSAAETLGTDAEGKQTAIGAMIDRVLGEVNREHLKRILLLSDGSQKALPPLNTPLPRDVASQVGNDPRRPVKVSTVVFGSTDLQGAIDLSVEDVVIAPEPFVKTTVPVNALIRTFGAANRDLTVRLLLEDRTGKAPGESGPMRELSASRNAQPFLKIRPTKNEQVIPVELSFVPDLPGEFKLSLRVESIDGELKLNNNEISTILSVRKGGVKIAYFDKPYWEQKYIQLANRSKKIDIDFIRILPAPVPGANEIDPALFEPGQYDAYIIGDVPAKVFGPEILSQLSNRIKEGAGLLMLGGFRTYGPGGYGRTALEDVLPVRVDRGFGSGDVIDDANHYLKDLTMLPTRDGLSHYLMRLDSVEQNLDRWEKLETLQTANRLEPKNAAVQVLAATDADYPRKGEPLLFMHEVGASRVIAFAGDTTWQWVMSGHRAEHQRFWQQMILYLARKEFDGEQPIWARVSRRSYNRGQSVQIEMGARDKDGLPITDAELKAAVLPPEGDETSVSPKPNGSTQLADFQATNASGDYWVRVSGKRNGESLGPDGWTRFIVNSQDLELDYPVAKPDVMKEIAVASGGDYLKPEGLKQHLEMLLKEKPETENLGKKQTRLWDNWWFLCVFVGLISLEWFFRKRRGLV